MARVRPVRGRMGVRSGPRRVPLQIDRDAWERFVKWVENEAYEAIGWDAANPEAVVDAVLEEAELIDRVEGETRWGGITADEDAVREALDSGALDRAVDRRRPDIVADPDLWDDVEESVGEEFSALPSADRAMLIHAASGEPPRLGRAHPERPSGSPPYEPVPELPPEQVERNREGIRKARETLGSSPVGGQQSMEQTFAPAIEQSRQSLGLSTIDQMLLMAALAAVTGGGSAALRAAPLVGRGALASVAGLGALVGGASPAHAASDSDMGAAGGSAVGDIRRRRALLADLAAGRGRTRGQR